LSHAELDADRKGTHCGNARPNAECLAGEEFDVDDIVRQVRTHV